MREQRKSIKSQSSIRELGNNENHTIPIGQLVFWDWEDDEIAYQFCICGIYKYKYEPF